MKIFCSAALTALAAMAVGCGQNASTSDVEDTIDPEAQFGKFEVLAPRDRTLPDCAEGARTFKLYYGSRPDSYQAHIGSTLSVPSRRYSLSINGGNYTDYLVKAGQTTSVRAGRLEVGPSHGVSGSWRFQARDTAFPHHWSKNFPTGCGFDLLAQKYRVQVVLDGYTYNYDIDLTD